MARPVQYLPSGGGGRRGGSAPDSPSTMSTYSVSTSHREFSCESLEAAVQRISALPDDERGSAWVLRYEGESAVALHSFPYEVTIEDSSVSFETASLEAAVQRASFLASGPGRDAVEIWFEGELLARASEDSSWFLACDECGGEFAVDHCCERDSGPFEPESLPDLELSDE